MIVAGGGQYTVRRHRSSTTAEYVETMLEKQDSGVYLSATEPSSPSDAGAALRPVAFFVDVAAQPGTPGQSRNEEIK